ncbi:Histone acetyltransferase KAT2A [Bienertia sinuspersici]
MYNTLHISNRSTVHLPDEAKVMRDDVKARYSISNGPCILELKSQIADCRQHDKSVATYFGELRRLQDELSCYQEIPTCTCTAAAEFAKLQESDLLYQFYIGLDSCKFDYAVSMLLMQDPPPSFNVAYSPIIADEHNQMISESHSADRAPNVIISVIGVNTVMTFMDILLVRGVVGLLVVIVAHVEVVAFLAAVLLVHPPMLVVGLQLLWVLLVMALLWSSSSTVHESPSAHT